MSTLPDSCNTANTNPSDDSSAMNVDVAPSDSIFEMAHTILSILDSEHWKSPRSDPEAEAISEHLQGLTAHLLTAFSESEKSAITGTTICQEIVLLCGKMLDEELTKVTVEDGILSQFSRQTDRLAAEAKELEERFQAAQTKVDGILTILPVSREPQAGEVKIPIFGEAPLAFFTQVAYDLVHLKPHLCGMVSYWLHVHQQVIATARQAETALVHRSKPEFRRNDISVAWTNIEFSYKDYTSRIERLFKSTILPRTIIETERGKVDTDPFEVILPSFYGSLTRDMKKTFESACRCVSILEPWNQAKSKHPLANVIIARTQAEFEKFFNLLSRSSEVAQNGIKLVENMSYLCGNVLNPKKDQSELEKFVAEVIPQVNKASDNSKLIRTDFRIVAVKFAEISNDIPITVKTIEEESTKAIAKAQKANQRPLRIFRFTFHLPELVGGDISLPFPLPLLSLVTQAMRANVLKKIEERKLRTESAAVALEMLKNVGGLLGEVGKEISKFIQYWIQVNLSLAAVEERIQEMRQFPETWSTRLELAQNQWHETAVVYRHYIHQIGYLSQIAPPVRAMTTKK